ncbi:hypothetical protein P152DRAFT_368612, partial [Eremomyces bilateralis CBS 781.70]
LNIKKKERKDDGGRRPAVGERKAQRTRVVISNTNALNVPDIELMTAEGVVDENNVGKVMALPVTTVDSLRAVGAFKNTQGWKFFRTPSTLIRKETVEMARKLDEAAKGEAIRQVLIGEKKSGKSVLLLQALAHAFMRDWVVINYREARELTMGFTDYAPIPNTDPTRYSQPALTATLLTSIVQANRDILSKLTTALTHNPPVTLPQGTSLLRLAELATNDPDIALPVFHALWSELTYKPPADAPPASQRPPVLLAVDALAHFMRPSAYLSADAQTIHAHDLDLIQHFSSCLSGASALPNGGAVIAAMNNSDVPSAKSLNFALARAEAIQKAKKAEGEAVDVPTWNPYEELDERVFGCFDPAVVEVVRLGGVSKEEARGVMDYWIKSGMCRKEMRSKMVNELWTLSGRGVIGELER